MTDEATPPQADPAVALDEVAARRQPAVPARRRRWWLRVPLAALLAYCVWCTALFFGQDRLLFRRDLVRSVPPEQLAWAATAVRLEIPLNAGQSVEARFLPAPQASPEHPAPAVVFCHGNAELIDNLSRLVQKYHALGCSVLLPEYRGYGRSGGAPSQEAITADAVRFYDMMLERPDVDRRRTIIHGRSLGGGIAAQLAARRKPAALILESTFTSVAGMAHRYLVPTWLVRNPFRTDEVLPTLDIPVLITHGTLDVVIPVAHGRELSKLARRGTYIEYTCGHDDLPPPRQEEEHWRQIATFLENAGVPGGV